MSNERLSIDAVMSLMADYAEAVGEERAERAKYDGYSWDYFGYRYLEAVDRAKAKAEDALNDYIAEIVRRELANKENPGE